MQINPILKEDLSFIFKNTSNTNKLEDTTILLTGCAGFLGFSLLHYLTEHSKSLGIKRIIGIDNFKAGKPVWLKILQQAHNQKFNLYSLNLIDESLDTIPHLNEVTHVLHMASIASPPMYRKYPIDTIDINVWGLRRLLEYYKKLPIKSFLFFSTSEIYGDPPANQIPTQEEYYGNVATMGPRACYDEGKRFGETMCYLFAKEYALPIVIVRPFNNYGPGMKLEDGRLPADLASATLEDRDFVLHSDGKPTRTFCYISDAIVGYLKALFHEKFDYFNIGNDSPEISVRTLTEIFSSQARETLNYKKSIKFLPSPDKNFLTHNPQRRCPNIDKAKQLLGFNPAIGPEEGVMRFLNFLKYERENS